VIIIESNCKRSRATLRGEMDGVDGGVEISIYDRGRAQTYSGKLIKQELVEVPFHVACDDITATIDTLPKHHDWR
jgi:hypothetical protein